MEGEDPLLGDRLVGSISYIYDMIIIVLQRRKDKKKEGKTRLWTGSFLLLFFCPSSGCCSRVFTDVLLGLF